MLNRTPVRKVCGKPRPGRLKSGSLQALRIACWTRDLGLCQRCAKRTIFGVSPDCADAFHLAHKRNKRMWGDTLDNVQTECGDCHRKYHQCGPSMTKPVPAKVQS